ncbi:MAG: divalent-cation tolerance protein CutA [Endomicrobiales bacterium]
MKNIAVFITASSREEGEKISKALVEEKLVACVNLFPEIHSRYWWKGKIETSKEVFLLAKTRDSLLGRVTARVKALHSYEVPEVTALPIAGGNREYLKWIGDSVRKGTAKKAP